MKFVLRILKWVILVPLILVVLLLVFLLLDRDYQKVELSAAELQSIQPQKQFNSEVDSNYYYELLDEFGSNKTLALGFEYQCLLALSHYPELKETPIDFLVQPAFIPLSSRPNPVTVVFPWIQRRYMVVISDASVEYFEKILLKNTPFNGQVGIIGHELAHTLYYQDKSALQLAKIAYQYEYDNVFHDAFERATDKRAVAHGLGYQLYDYAFFVRIAFGDTQKQIANERGNTYLSPNELADEMEQFAFYREALDAPEIYFSD